MKRVQRFDIARMDKLNVTPEGFLETSVRAARTGILVYNDENGKEFRELCLPEELFKKESTDSMKLKPVTNNHPFELLNSENTKEHQIGYTGEDMQRDGKFLKIGKVVITDKDAIADIENGKQEVSCGYILTLDMNEGYWDETNEKINHDGRGEKFDAIQRDRMYNHLALVNKGRAGTDVRLRLDSELNLIYDSKKREDDKMFKIKIGSKEFEVSQDVAAAFDAFVSQMQASIDSTTAELEAFKKKNADEKDVQIEKLTAENEKLKGANDALEKQMQEATDPKRFNERVGERVDLMATAQAIMGADDEEMQKLKDLDDIGVKRAVIKAKMPDVTLDGKSDDYVNGQYETLSQIQNKDNGDDDGDGADDGFGDSIVRGRKDRAGEDELAEKKRIEREKKDSEAYKQPVGPLASNQG